jgi:hypothetical protein
MAAKLKIVKMGDEILIVHCCFSISQILTAATWKFFFQPIYTDYAN